MTLEVYTPRAGMPAPIRPGTAGIDQKGNLTLHQADLERAGIGDRAVVLIDAAAMLLALRRPAADEADLVVAVGTPGAKHGKPGQRRQVWIRGPLETMRLEPDQVAGRLVVRHEDNMLVIALNEELPKGAR